MGMEVAPSGGVCVQRSGVFAGELSKRLCQPTLENNFAVVNKDEDSPSPEVPDGSSLLGWQCMVAPLNQTPRQKISSGAHQTQGGLVHQLSSSTNARPKVGPPLCDVIRQSLQRKEVPVANINFHLSQIKSLPRYNRAF